MLHVGVRHRTSTPHESGNKMKRKKKLCVESIHSPARSSLPLGSGTLLSETQDQAPPGGTYRHYYNVLRGFAKKKKFRKSDITMEVGAWVQVSLGFLFCGKSSQNSSKQVLIFCSSIPCVFCLYIHC